MKPWVWLDTADVTAYHGEAIAAHGGRPGLRDRGLLESALARPRNLSAYGEPSAFDLAAAYAFGIARKHPFVDGNKRAALIASVTFLELNGWRFVATEEDTVVAFLGLAAGKSSERQFSRWLESSSRKLARKR